MAKKRKGKYPNLDISQNTKSRTDYIEPDYIDGVIDQYGEKVIRSLLEDEKEWLNNFYGETIAVSDTQLNPTPEIKEYMKQKADLKSDNVKIKKKKGYKSTKQAMKDSEFRFNLKKIEEIEKSLDFLREEQGVLHPTCDEQRELYTDNNTRNACVFNNRKARGMLLELTEATVDPFIAKYWDILASFGYDAQDAQIELVEKRLREQGFLPKKAEDFSDPGSDTDDKRKKKKF
jgi:hypothetical protein